MVGAVQGRYGRCGPSRFEFKIFGAAGKGYFLSVMSGTLDRLLFSWFVFPWLIVWPLLFPRLIFILLLFRRLFFSRLLFS